MRVLALGAHPDDLEILCGGTLALYVQQGHQVVMSYATKGEVGNDSLTLAECFATRSQEARDAAQVIGAPLIPLGFDDNRVHPDDPAQQDRVLDLLREVNPDLVLTHAPEDYHPDHRAISALVFWCNPVLGIARYAPRQRALDHVPVVYYMDCLPTVDFRPSHFVDISAVMDSKRAMVSAHRSQLTFLKKYFDTDIMEQVEVVARYHGLQAGVRHAEAFRPCLDFGHGQHTRRWLP